MRSKRNKKGSVRKSPRQARDLGPQEDIDPDKPFNVANRSDRRHRGERGTIAPSIGPKAEPSVKDILRIARQRKKGTGQPEHVQRWQANSQSRKSLSTQPISVLKPTLGAKVMLLQDAGYATALDVAREVDYRKLTAIRGVGPAFLGQLRNYLIGLGFNVEWEV